MAISSSSMRLNTNDKKESAAKPIGSKKDKKKKKKKNKASESSKATKPFKSYESLTNNSFLMDPADWQEADNGLAFDDVSSMVNRAVHDLYAVPPDARPANALYMSSRYYVYKVWPDKVAVKRSYENESDDPLFMMHPYVIEEDEAVLGDGQEVELGFLPAGGSNDFTKAVREVDISSIDDPAFSMNLDDEENEDEDRDKSDDEDVDEIEDEIDSEDDDEDDDDDSDDNDVEEDDVQEEESTLREDIANLKEQDFTESMDCVLDNHARIVEGKGGNFIIENMALLGAKSKNGRTYSKDVRIKASKVFEGIKAYMNHPDADKVNDPRKVQELIGRHKGVYFDETTDMLRSNLHLSPTHLVKEYLIPHAKANPGILGNSINASGKIDSKGNVLEVTKGRSVDVVAEPATTNGLFESVQNNNGTKTTASTNSEGGEKPMTIKELLENAEHASLVAELREHFREELDVESTVQELQEENQELKEQVAEYQMKDKKQEDAAAITKMLKESKLDEEDQADIQGLLEEAKPERRAALIERFEKLAEKAANGEKPSASREKNITEATGGKKPEKGELRSLMASGLSSRRRRF